MLKFFLSAKRKILDIKEKIDLIFFEVGLLDIIKKQNKKIPSELLIAVETAKLLQEPIRTHVLDKLINLNDENVRKEYNI